MHCIQVELLILVELLFTLCKANGTTHSWPNVCSSLFKGYKGQFIVTMERDGAHGNHEGDVGQRRKSTIKSRVDFYKV
jgi:hypothetical protein